MNAAFPIPAPNQAPHHDLAHAKSLLRILHGIFDDAVVHGMSKETANDVYSVLSDIGNDIEPVLLLLDRIDSEDLLIQYRDCRREDVLKSQGCLIVEPEKNPGSVTRMVGGERNG